MRRLHSRLFLPLFALTLTAAAFRGLWPVLIGPWHGPRLHLNLFLAWVPYLLALSAVALHQNAPRRPWLFRGVAVLWLLFLPNAPYLITDWLYLRNWQEELWFAIGMMTACTLCGMLLAAVSLHLMQTVVHVRMGLDAGRMVAVVAITLSGAGVYLGRFVRLNSWDAITHPRSVWNDAVASLQAQQNHAGILAFSTLFALLFGGVYYAVVEMRRAPRSREELAVWGRDGDPRD